MGIKLLTGSRSVYGDKDYKLFLKWGLRLSLLPNISHGGYNHSSAWSGSKPLASPWGQVASCVWACRPKVSSLPCQGSGVICPAVGNRSRCVPSANHEVVTAGGTLAGVMNSSDGAWAMSWTMQVTLGPRSDLCSACFYWGLSVLVLCALVQAILPPAFGDCPPSGKRVQNPLYHPARKGGVQLLVGRWSKNKKGKALLCFLSSHLPYSSTRL